jgi:hypothetical protein
VIDDTEITCFVQTQRLHEFDLVVSASESWSLPSYWWHGKGRCQKFYCLQPCSWFWIAMGLFSFVSTINVGCCHKPEHELGIPRITFKATKENLHGKFS